MRVVLREVLRRVDLVAPDRRPEKVRVKHITMVPAKGARVVVTNRVRAAATGVPATASRQDAA
jgi:hypothetical protein